MSDSAKKRPRSRPDPGAWARLNDEEVAARAREAREREQRAEVLERAPEQQHASETKPWVRTPDSPAFPPAATYALLARLLAQAADSLILAVVIFALFVPAVLASKLLGAVVLLGGAFVGQLIYYPLTQRRTGQSPGKRLAGIRVVDAEGRTPSTGALVRRTLPLLLEYLYFVALIAMVSSPYRQRLGDRWAGTYVISDRSAAG